MIVELILKEKPQLELKGYEEIKFAEGAIYANPIEKRVEIVVKHHHDGRVSVFTDNSEVIQTIAQTMDISDIHAK